MIDEHEGCGDEQDEKKLIHSFEDLHLVHPFREMKFNQDEMLEMGIHPNQFIMNSVSNPIEQSVLNITKKRRDDRKKFLEKKLSVENLAKVGFMRSSWSSLIPGAIDTAMYPFMEKSPFSYGRNTELASQFISGIPTVNLLNTTVDTVRTGVKLGFTDYQASKRDVQKFLSLIALQNALIIKNVNNIIVDELGEQYIEDL